MSMEIVLDGSMRSIGRNSGEKQKWKDAIRSHMASLAPNYNANNNNTFKMYSLGTSHSHNVGGEKDLTVFNFSSKRPSELIDVNKDPEHSTKIGEVNIFIANAFTPQAVTDGIVQIKTEEGFVLAEYQISNNQLNILFDLTYTFTPERNYVMGYILKEIASYLEEMHLINSFKHSKQKDKLLDGLRAQVKRDEEREKNNLLDKVAQYKSEIDSLRSSLTTTIRNHDSAFNKISNMSEYAEKRVATFMDEVALILGFDKVEDMYVEGERLCIHTAPLNIRASGSGQLYFGGRYIIKIKVSNSEVRFFAKDDNVRQGYWTGRDPHPHVDGSGGSACLGNASSTIAELCSQNQLYPLTLVLIDFLENANTNDSAGAKVVNWPAVKADGTVGSVGRSGQLFCTLNNEWYDAEDVTQCDITGEMTHEDDLYDGRNEHDTAIRARIEPMRNEGYLEIGNVFYHPDHERLNNEETTIPANETEVF